MNGWVSVGVLVGTVDFPAHASWNLLGTRRPTERTDRDLRMGWVEKKGVRLCQAFASSWANLGEPGRTWANLGEPGRILKLIIDFPVSWHWIRCPPGGTRCQPPLATPRLKRRAVPVCTQYTAGDRRNTCTTHKGRGHEGEILHYSALGHTGLEAACILSKPSSKFQYRNDSCRDYGQRAECGIGGCPS
jgi:hypothetical protein